METSQLKINLGCFPDTSLLEFDVTATWDKHDVCIIYFEASKGFKHKRNNWRPSTRGSSTPIHEVVS